MTYSIIFYIKVIYLNLENIYVRLTSKEYWKHIGNTNNGIANIAILQIKYITRLNKIIVQNIETISP